MQTYSPIDSTIPFETDYYRSRRLFRAAADRAGALSVCYPLPGYPELTIDVAVLGDRKARRSLVLSAVAHGPEIAGAALVTRWLRAGRQTTRRAPNVQQIFIHALNPFGFKNFCRADQDGIDVARNFGNFQNVTPQLYHKIVNTIVPVEIQGLQGLASNADVMWKLLKHGPKILKDAVTLGQCDYPFRPYYTGIAPSFSRQVFEKMGNEFLDNATHITHLDFHSGFSPYGQIIIMLHTRDNAEKEYAWACDTWPGKTIHVLGESKKNMKKFSPVEGDILTSLPHRFGNQAIVRAACIEFGTYHWFRVFMATRAGAWLHYRQNLEGLHAAAIQKRLLETYTPSDLQWQRAVQNSGTCIYRSTLKDLATTP